MCVMIYDMHKLWYNTNIQHISYAMIDANNVSDKYAYAQGATLLFFFTTATIFLRSIIFCLRERYHFINFTIIAFIFIVVI